MKRCLTIDITCTSPRKTSKKLWIYHQYLKITVCYRTAPEFTNFVAFLKQADDKHLVVCVQCVIKPDGYSQTSAILKICLTIAIVLCPAKKSKQLQLHNWDINMTVCFRAAPEFTIILQHFGRRYIDDKYQVVFSGAEKDMLNVASSLAKMTDRNSNICRIEHYLTRPKYRYITSKHLLTHST